MGSTFSWFIRNISKGGNPLFIGLCCGVASILPDLDHLIYYATGWAWPEPVKGRLLHPFLFILAVYMVIHYSALLSRLRNK